MTEEQKKSLQEMSVNDLKEQIKAIPAEKKWAFLCYLPLLNLLACPLVAVKKVDSKFCLFHARQGILLFALWFLTVIVALVSPTLSLMLWGVVIILHIAGMVIVFRGQSTPFPVVGSLALKIPEYYFYSLLTGKTPAGAQAPTVSGETAPSSQEKSNS